LSTATKGYYDLLKILSTFSFIKMSEGGVVAILYALVFYIHANRMENMTTNGFQNGMIVKQILLRV
jgi:hypothetical protein